jgi:hypothetical protein
VDEVSAEVWDQDVLPGRVEDCFVGVWGVLTAGDCARTGQRIGEGLRGCDVARGGYVVSLEGTAGTVMERDWESVVCRTKTV